MRHGISVNTPTQDDRLAGQERRREGMFGAARAADAAPRSRNPPHADRHVGRVGLAHHYCSSSARIVAWLCGDLPCSGQAAIFSSFVAGENMGPVNGLPIILVAPMTTARPQTGHSAFGFGTHGRALHRARHTRLNLAGMARVSQTRTPNPGSRSRRSARDRDWSCSTARRHRDRPRRPSRPDKHTSGAPNAALPAARASTKERSALGTTSDRWKWGSTSSLALPAPRCGL